MSTQEQVFEMTGADNRAELVKGSLKLAQKPSGKDVEGFNDDLGFFLKAKLHPINYQLTYVKQTQAVAELSLKAPQALRELYYTVRNTPELVEPFKNVNIDRLYSSVLKTISTVEILCDIPREEFTVGNLSKGFIYYFHSERYADKLRKIAFTENIARKVLTLEELEACENIIVVEKNSIANRLVELGVSELTNSVIVTVGGYFNRSIWELISRFKEEKNIICLCDGDAYGIDMLRTIEVGTEASRHLPYKFPPSRYPNIHLAGLFPSIGETLGLPNDVAQKRPLNNPYVRRRINFLLKHGILNEQDHATWMRDKTYELEAMSSFIRDEEGKPIGAAAYLIEYMRIFNIPIKPPLPPDDELEKEFRKVAKQELEEWIYDQLDSKCPDSMLMDIIADFFYNLRMAVTKVINDRLKPLLEEALKEVTAKEIKYHIYKQYAANPGLSSYDLKIIAAKLRTQEKFEVTWSSEQLEEDIREALAKYEERDLPTPHSDIVEEDIQFAPIHNETKKENSYDLALQFLQVPPEKALQIRQALLKRFKPGEEA
jgi:DNA topoisomerase VI subunit A/6-pyruvoyl-tetrahydropterin synthase